MLPKQQIIDYLDKLRKNKVGIRIHGNGFIQIDESSNTRVHLWSRIIPRQSTYTGIHDHRFGFFSTVIYGDGLTNKIYLPEKKVEQIATSHDKQYRVYVARQRQGEDTILEPTQYIFDINEFWPWYNCVKPGQAYSMPVKMFHESLLLEKQYCAITHMVKTDLDKDHLPRVLCPKEFTPDNDFNRNFFTEDYCWALTFDIVQSHNNA